MSTPANHWKLGLFVVSGFVLALSSVAFLGARSMQQQVVSYHTYFDESVQGLEVGSPVKYRGVTIGNVSAIDVAQDRRHVSVTSHLVVQEIVHLGLSDGKGRTTKIHVPVDLRVQLASQGITGVKFLQMDFFDVKDNPPPKLPFEVPVNYIPAAVSTMKNLEDAIVKAVNRIPELAEGILKVTVQISRMLDGVEQEKLPEQAGVMLKRANEVLGGMQAAVKQVDAPKLSRQAQEALGNLNDTIKQATLVLAKLDGERGFVANAQRATSAVGEAATGARGTMQEFEETLRDIQQVTASIQRVADALERDPDMLLKGRGKSK